MLYGSHAAEDYERLVMTSTVIREQIRERMMEYAITAWELSKYTGVDNMYVELYIGGKATGEFPCNLILKVCDLFGISVTSKIMVNVSKVEKVQILRKLKK